jgi:dTDP-4-dehydrorhamnose reductase
MISAARPLLITGATGTLGQACAKLCVLRGLSYYLTTRQTLDIADPASVEAAIAQFRPWAIVNTAGYVRVDAAEEDAERCRRENAVGPAVIAAACAEHGIPLLTFSSDLVFDGSKSTPYVEGDPARPLNVYGQTKAEAEASVLSALPRALIVRTSAFFGPWDAYNVLTVTLRRLKDGESVEAANDVTISQTYVPDLLNTSLDILIDGESGVWHLANGGALTWAELGSLVAARAGFDPGRIQGRPACELGFVAARPPYTVLGSERGMLLPSLEDALERYLAESVR